jgi:hypothetical protein
VGSGREALLGEVIREQTRLPTPSRRNSRMEQKIAPRERKAQEIQALMQGQWEAQSGEEVVSTLGRLSPERV